MKLTGENRINASPQEVWRALNDPEILRQAMPGCETLEKIDDTHFKATVTTKIGPVQAKFSGEVELSDLNPPHGYTISGKGSGGVAGNARGSAKVKLEPDGAGTKLSYDVDAQVTGKLAQLGSRLIDSTAKMLAGQFFNKFEQLVSKPVEPAPAEAATSSAASSPAAKPAGGSSAAAGGSSSQMTQSTTGIPPWLWAVIIGGCIALFAYYFK
jgi:carbon monoxide dehydrogenase subunit G